jgi:predicted ferric reductase
MTTWIILRSAGIGAYVLLFLAVAWGLVGTTSALGKRVPKATATTLHQYLGTAVVALLVLHLGGLLLDKFRPFHLIDFVVPFHNHFRPWPVTFGILALYLMVIVLLTSWYKKRIGTAWWRRFHVWATPVFIMAMVHGVFTGTDTMSPYMWWTYMVTGAIVLFLLVVRGLTVGFRPERKPHPGPAAVAEPSVARRSTSVPAAVPAGDIDPAVLSE